jgi:hypothetical protein
MNFFSRWNFGYQEAFHANFLFFHDEILAIREPFTRTFLSHDGISAITEPFTRTFLSHDGISTITEPFHDFFFLMMESQLSGSLSHEIFFFHDGILGYHGAFSRIFLSHDGISKNARFGGRLFSYISQRVFT